VFEHYKVDNFLAAFGLLIHPDYRGTAFSGTISQSTARKAGFQDNVVLVYEDLHKIQPGLYFPAEPCNGYPYPWISMDISNKLDNGYIHGYPWIFRIKYFEQSFNCKMTAKLTKYSGITLQLINFDCL
jgi:hypothetical protein